MTKYSFSIVKYKDRYYIKRVETSSCLFWTLNYDMYLSIQFSWMDRIEYCHGYESQQKAEEAFAEYNRREKEKYDSEIHIKTLEP